MTTSDNCLAHIHSIVRGETPNLGDLFFFFSAIRRLLSLVNSATPLISGKKILKGLEMTKDVLEWLEHGVDIKIHETF